MLILKGVVMKYLITFFWTFCIAQVTFFLGAKLNNMDYNFVQASILGVCITIAVIIISKILPPIPHENTSNEQ